jgi:hypothetical protein
MLDDDRAMFGGLSIDRFDGVDRGRPGRPSYGLFLQLTAVINPEMAHPDQDEFRLPWPVRRRLRPDASWRSELA